MPWIKDEYGRDILVPEGGFDYFKKNSGSVPTPSGSAFGVSGGVPGGVPGNIPGSIPSEEIGGWTQDANGNPVLVPAGGFDYFKKKAVTPALPPEALPGEGSVPQGTVPFKPSSPVMPDFLGNTVPTVSDVVHAQDPLIPTLENPTALHKSLQGETVPDFIEKPLVTIGNTDAFKSLVAGMYSNIPMSYGGGMEWAGDKFGIEGLSETGKGMREFGEYTADLYTSPDWSPPIKFEGWKTLADPRFYTRNVMRNVPLMASLLIPTILGAEAGGVVAGAAGWGKLGSLGNWGTKLLKTLGGLSSGVPLEAALEAGGVYTEAKNRGLSEEEAMQAADDAFLKNAALLSVTNVPELAAMFSPAPKWLGGMLGAAADSKLGRAAVGAGRVGMAGASEGLEEGAQEVIQRSSLGDEVNFDPAMQESIAQGLVLGGGPGIIGALQHEMQTRAYNKASKEARKSLETAVQEKVDAGTPVEEAVKQVFDEFAGTEEGDKVVGDSMQEVIQDVADVEKEAVEKQKSEQAQPAEQPEPIQPVQPAGQSIQQPGETPVQQPIEPQQPVPQPVEQPTDQPVEPPAEPPVQPVEQPVEPMQQPSISSAEEQAKTEPESLAEISTEPAKESLTEASTESGKESTVEPAKEPVDGEKPKQLEPKKLLVYGRTGNNVFKKWANNEHVMADLNKPEDPYVQAYRQFFEKWYQAGKEGIRTIDVPFDQEIDSQFPHFLTQLFYQAGKADAKVQPQKEEGKIDRQEEVAKTGENEVQSKQEEPVTEEPKPEERATPSRKVAVAVKDMLVQGQKFTSAELFKIADRFFEGTQAEKKYTSKDAYDALELGVNLYLLEHKKSVGPMVSAEQAKRILESIRQEILEAIPTQTKRTEEQDRLQQFSTPPNIAYIAAWVANISHNDIVLEPSAGIGGLAVFAKSAGAREVIVNEFSPRRAEVLKEMGFDQVFTENAEQLNNVLPKDIKPTVIIMNPPFSSTARIRSKNDTKNAIMHMEQALKKLAPGGRLVAIVGQGMSDNAANFKGWWNKLRETYNIRANIGINGKNYSKYGTNFGVQLVVIDKTGPLPKGINSTVVNSVDTLEDALPLLEAIKNDRITSENRPTQQAAGKPASEKPTEQGGPETGPEPTVPVPTDKLGAAEREDNTQQPGKQERTPRPETTSGKTPVPREPGTGNEPSDQGGPGPGEPAGNVGQSKETGQEDTTGSSGVPDGKTDVRTPGETAKEPGSGTVKPAKTAKTEIKVESESEAVQQTDQELSDAVFTDYMPQKLKIPGAKQHPGALAQSAAMAAVEPPTPTYTPNLPKETVSEGKLSIAQLESVVYAGQAHQQTLPDGTRRGFFIGDGTGVGKGREISGIILDNIRQGRKKAVWISKNAPLFNDSLEHFEATGGDKKLLFELGNVKMGTPVKQKDGVLFTTYDTLGQGLSSSKTGELIVKEGKSARIDQVINWLGKDFDGVIVFDEAHQMQNSITQKRKRGAKKPSTRALAGIELQKRLPDARIVYASATGATEVSNLAYADRLGLWGEGTPFANKLDFIDKVQAGGLAAMELVARDMKAMGAYIARNLSYDGVTYGTLEHNLTPEQTEIYDEMAKAWQIVLQNVNKALEETGQGKDGYSKGRAIGQFWVAQQRFFNQVLTSVQMPSVVEQVKKDLANGNAVVMQLVNTNEAAQNRAIAKMNEEDSLEDLDLTPRDMLMQYLDKSFPIQQYEEYEDDNGNIRSRPVVDSHGNPVVNQEAMEMKEELLSKLGALKVPEGPLEIILNEFGTEMVAEITGRTRRVVRESDDGRMKAKLESRTPKHASADAQAFLDDKKKILVFSDAGGTGRSYHASLKEKNQRRRVHYLIQAGWRADNAVQGFGRTHRTNQANAPHYVLVTTNLKGQKRFISSIARRLDQLGALTKGQRQTGSQGLFSAKDNLESDLARDALQQFYENLAGGQIEGITAKELLSKMGLSNMLDENRNVSNENPDLRDITKFLNRILALESTLQNKIFEEFIKRLDAKVEKAIADGTLDVGLENYRADKVVVSEEKSVFIDESSGAETKYFALEAHHKNKKVSFENASRLPKLKGFYRNTKSERVYAVKRYGHRTLSNGSVVEIYQVQGQVKSSSHNISKADFEKGNWGEIPESEAETAWNEALGKVSEFRVEKVNLISGALLPIWDRLPTGHVRVIRVKTEDGRMLLGRIVPEKAIDLTLKKLGADRTKQTLSPTELSDKILKENYTIYLSNEWRMVRRRVSGENRIELIGRDLYPHMGQLKNEGIFIERIDWETRFFVPTGAMSAQVIEKVIKYRPVVDMVSPGVNEEFSLPSKSVRKKADSVLKNINSSSNEYSLVHSPQKTSLNQVAAGLKKAVAMKIFTKGMLVADVGGGKYEKGTQFMAQHGIENLVYDPYAMDTEHNESVLARIEKNKGADGVALNNVLNVIPTAEERKSVIDFLYSLLKPGSKAIITVYKGNGSGKGAQLEFADGTSTWQENRNFADYENEIREAFPEDATIEKKAGMYVVTKAQMSTKSPEIIEEDLQDEEFAFAKKHKVKKKKKAKKPAPTIEKELTDPSELTARAENISPKAAREMGEKLSQLLNTVLRSGRHIRGTEGSFSKYSKTGKIKKQKTENWRVMGHEHGHGIAFILLDAANFKPKKSEMWDIAEEMYPGDIPEGKKTQEGLAEYLMLWFSDNKTAREMAPVTSEMFDEFLDNNPEIGGQFDAILAIAELDLEGDPLAQMANLIAKPGERVKVNVGEEYRIPWFKKLQFQLADFTIPLKDLYRAAVEQGYEGLDPAKLAAVSGSAREKAANLFSGSARDEAGRFLLPGKRSLQEIVEEAAQIPHGVQLMDWIYHAMRYQERYNVMEESEGAKQFELPKTKAYFDTVVDLARERYPEMVELIEEYAEILSEINLRLLVRGEVISEEDAEHIRAGSNIYLPLYHVGEQEYHGSGNNRRAAGEGVRRFKGHEGQTMNFIEASITRLNDTVLAVEIEKIMQAIEGSIRQPNMGLFGDFIQAPIKSVSVSVEDMARHFDGEINIEDEERVIRMFMPGGLRDIGQRETILMARHGGRHVYMRVAPDIYRAALSMKPITVDIVAKTLAYLTQIGRFGALANVRYVTNAIMRDVIVSKVQSKAGMGERSLIADFIKGVGTAIGMNQEVMDMYVQSGGYGSAPQEVINGALRASVTDGLMATPVPGWKRTATGALVRVVTSPLEALRILEEMPRLAEFEAVLKRELKPLGVSYEEFMAGEVSDELAPDVEKALLEAAYASREILVNFGLHGIHEGFRKYARTVQFMQGSIQGIYRFSRQVKDKPYTTLMRMAIYMVPLTLLAWALSSDDDKYKDMPSESRDRYWWFPIPGTKDYRIALAKPYEYALPANMLERFLDWAMTDEPNKRKPLTDFKSAVKTSFGVPMTSMLIDTIISLYSGKDSFGNPIEPEREQNLLPQDRFSTGTSKFAINMAKAVAVFTDKGPSPRMIDYFMKNSFGGIGKTVTNILSNPLNPLKWLKGDDRPGVEYWPVIGSLIYGPGEGGSRIVDKFYEDKARAEQIYKSSGLWQKQWEEQARARGLSAEDTATYVNENLRKKLKESDVRLILSIPVRNMFAREMSDMRAAQRDIAKRADISPEQKKIFNLRMSYLQKLAAGYIYQSPIPDVPFEAQLSDVQVQDMLKYYDYKVQKAITNALRTKGGPL
ncbi:strawberry notch-like NTP hydrolase domain-containing protein [Phosphitispora fastidiosa]|uniref:strawberry notch-like NTP hydrolase domain-containing protein n=1 Tax=Phosphitispora fastidiosa TaxID=2837202 RepID=UPI001E64C008|nr:strawberry notch family protein [Phosphitispora fastidiosa]MBU7006292.1 hypothetical protein [Phosphitispora fastidiosa]